MHDRYADAVAEVGAARRRGRLRPPDAGISYLHLTRFVRILLDRKDRMSMAVGLEVRVPFCDHRLVEYVYNTPWSLKTFDGREKSLLRGAVATCCRSRWRPGKERVPVHIGSAVRCRNPSAREGCVGHWR